MEDCLSDSVSTEEDPVDVVSLNLGTGFTETVEGAPKFGCEGKCGFPCVAEISELSW